MTARLAILASLLFACGGSPPPPPAPRPAPTPGPAPAPVPAPTASGVWLGTLAAGATSLRIQLRLDRAAGTCALDSLDQGAFGIPCTASEPGAVVKIEVPAVRGTFEGKLSADASTLEGTWSQGVALPLVLARQATAIQKAVPTMEPAQPAIEVARLADVMDKDLAPALAVGGDLGPGTDAGIAIGVIQHGVRRVLAYGTAKADSIFEIGSVSKTFTGLLLAQLVEQKKVKLDEPVRALLPTGTVAAPAAGAEITLLDLGTHRSGLPRLPDNLKPADTANPYAEYDRAALFAFLAAHGVARPDAPAFAYSNLGVGLLGEALAIRARASYEALLQRLITGPLAMKDTTITLRPAQTKRFIAGHGGAHAVVPPWTMNALVGAGGIRSTASDMLGYLEAQLHPPAGKPIGAAITASHAIQAAAMPGKHVALAWLVDDATGAYFHDGATGGFSSFVMLDPATEIGIVVLANTSIDARPFAQEVAMHVMARLTGRPALSLGPLKP